MNEPIECPSADEFACFIEGRAEEPTAERIRTHLDSCGSCRLLVGKALRSVSQISQPRTFPDGAILNRRFRIERFIARGGMGEVYEAWDLQLGETIALKTIVCTGLDNIRLFPRIRAEVQIARRITHPNVCRILEFGIAETEDPDAPDAVPFFTMEYLRGHTLREHIKTHGPLPESEAIELALQILDGLSAVHAAGIVHRDLKPENVFVVPTDTGQTRAVVMDFGLARSTVGQDGRSGYSSDALVGTPAYMAPEQTVGGQPSPTWDVYALGVILFELLTGTLPFGGKTVVAMAMARASQRAPLVSSLRHEVNSEFVAAIACCLQTDPQRRFASAEAVRQAIAAFRTPAGKRTRGSRVGLRPAAYVLGAAALLAAALVLYGHRPTHGTASEVEGRESASRSRTRLPDARTVSASPASIVEADRPILSSVGSGAAPTRRRPLEVEPESHTAHPPQAARAGQHVRTSRAVGVEVAAPRSTSATPPQAEPTVGPPNPRQPKQSDEVAIPAFALTPDKPNQAGNP